MASDGSADQPSRRAKPSRSQIRLLVLALISKLISIWLSSGRLVSGGPDFAVAALLLETIGIFGWQMYTKRGSTTTSPSGAAQSGTSGLDDLASQLGAQLRNGASGQSRPPWICVDIGAKNEPRFVFKGGTFLRMCCFEDYRYSADLDFSAVEGVSRGHAVELVTLGRLIYSPSHTPL
jgi:hypothetical protein